MTWQAYDPRLSCKITQAEFCQVIQNIHSGFDNDADVKSAGSAVTIQSRLCYFFILAWLSIVIIILVMSVTGGGLNNVTPVAKGIAIALGILLVVLCGAGSINARWNGPRVLTKLNTAHGAVVSRETGAWQARGISTTFCPRLYDLRVNKENLSDRTLVAPAKLRILV